MSRLDSFRPGDTVTVTGVAFESHGSVIGQRGTVLKTVKSRGVVRIRLNSGELRDCFPHNLTQHERSLRE